MVMLKKHINTAVVIVNWNGEKLLPVCLKSLQNQTYKRFKIILVDNGSVDGSVNYVKQNFPEVQIIELSKNFGFAKGSNIGISMALQDENVENVVLLNNDTRVEGDFLEKLVGAVDDKLFLNKKIGALAPKILLWQKKGADKGDKKNKLIDAVGARVSLDGRGYNIGHGEIDRGQYDKKQEVFGFCGGAALLRREMLEDVVKAVAETRSLQACRDRVSAEIFDKSFFAYYEDADLSWRMRWRGWKIFTAPEAVVWHLHSATADTVKSKTFKAYYLNRNRFFMMLKNFPGDLLWRGLKLVPRSYFKNKNDEDGDENKNENVSVGDSNNGADIKTELGTKISRKIIMVWVMTKVGCSLFLNSWRLWRKKVHIQRRRVVDLEELKKWF